MTKRFYVLIEIEADITGEPSDDEIRRNINRYLDKGKGANTYDFYFQGDRTVAIHDEKGRNLMAE